MTFTTMLVIAAVIGLIPGAIAHSKGHNFFTWWIFGALLFIVALPMAIVAKPSTATTRQCPACLAHVPREASVCQKCSRDLPVLPAAGWYPIEGQDYERYWDGFAWTDRGRRES